MCVLFYCSLTSFCLFHTDINLDSRSPKSSTSLTCPHYLVCQWPQYSMRRTKCRKMNGRISIFSTQRQIRFVNLFVPCVFLFVLCGFVVEVHIRIVCERCCTIFPSCSGLMFCSSYFPQILVARNPSSFYSLLEQYPKYLLSPHRLTVYPDKVCGV